MNTLVSILRGWVEIQLSLGARPHKLIIKISISHHLSLLRNINLCYLQGWTLLIIFAHEFKYFRLPNIKKYCAFARHQDSIMMPYKLN